MQTLFLTERYFQTRVKLFNATRNSTVVKKFFLALAMAGATGLLAQIRVPLPFTPVSLTGQTYAVMLSGVMLGELWGGLSMLFYVLLGAAGIPWFNGATGGVSVLLGPTGGYLIGFILTALLIGKLSDSNSNLKKFFPMTSSMIFAGLALIFVPGLIQLGLWSAMANGQMLSIKEILTIGFFPFILGDIFKAIFAGLTVALVTLKK